MIFNFISKHRTVSPGSLASHPVGSRVVVESFRAPARVAEHLMNLGVLPGTEVLVARDSPAGDPRIYRIEGGTEVALRADLSSKIMVRVCQSHGGDKK